MLPHLHPDDRPAFQQKKDQILGRKGPHREPFADEFRVIRADGSIRYIQVNGVQLRQTSDSDVELYVVAQDITQHREAEELLKRQSQELATVVERLKQFTAVVAHDLKNPLSSIALGAGLLKESADWSEVKTYGEMIEGAAHRTIHLINDLLEFAKLGSEAQVPKTEVDLTEVVGNVIVDVQAALKQSAGRIEVISDLPVVMGHQSQLKQLFQNLVANALKFRSKAAPHVVISATETEESWKFSVKDNGIGMAQAVRGRIFQPFQRFHSGYEGTGLGLSICKKIVELHGGKIEVHSELGQGTEFTFTTAKETSG
jgi:signal transduction histidine kinase